MSGQMLTISMNAVNEKEFNRTFDEYIKWNSRQPAEIINGKLYFVALQAMRKTKASDKGDIRNGLLAPSKTYADIPLAAILVNKQLGSKGKKGLTGQKMAEAMEKLIKKQQSKTQFLRSGWLPALKILDFWNKRNSDNLRFIKRFAPKKPEGVKIYGNEKGKAVYAKPDKIRTWGSITNFVGQGKQLTPTIKPLIQEGLNEGIAEEIRSMRTYIERKFREQFDKMRRTGRV